MSNRERSISPTAPPINSSGIDVSSLSPQELRIYKLYGKLPSRNDILTNKLKDRKYFDSGDYALDKLRSKQQQEKQDLSLQTPPADDQSSPLPNGLPTSAHHIPQMSGSPQKIPDDDFITSTVDDNNYLPLPNLEKFQNLQKKKSITRNGSVISITNKEITGINTKSNLETEVDSEDI